MPADIHPLMQDADNHNPASLIGPEIQHVGADRELAIALPNINGATLPGSCRQGLAGIPKAGNVMFRLAQVPPGYRVVPESPRHRPGPRA